MKAKVILNPYANRWNARKRWPEAEAALKAAGVDFDLSVTERPQHATELAEDAIRRGFSPIIVAGGDGTIDEIINGLARVQTEGPIGPVGLLPLGTANDLMFGLGLPENLTDAARVIAKGQSRSVDIGSLNGKFFANNSALGLEPYVNVKQEKISYIKGVLRYLVSALLAINDNLKWQAHMEWAGGRYDGPLTLLSVGNGSRTGGIFFMTPHADARDGLLDFVYGFRPTRLKVLQLLPQTMSPEGKFLSAEGMQEMRATWMKIHLDQPAPAHTDGELFHEWQTDFEYRIDPGRLQVLMP